MGGGEDGAGTKAKVIVTKNRKKVSVPDRSLLGPTVTKSGVKEAYMKTKVGFAFMGTWTKVKLSAT